MLHRFIMSIMPTAFGPILKLKIDPRALPEDLSCTNTSPLGECSYVIGPCAGGVCDIKIDSKKC